jgi:hypothetical protein
MLCPVRRPVTTLHCVLLKENNLVIVVGLRPEIFKAAKLNFKTKILSVQNNLYFSGIQLKYIYRFWLSRSHLKPAFKPDLFLKKDIIVLRLHMTNIYDTNQ